MDKGRISSTQFMFAAACLIHASTLLTTFLASVTFQDSWLAVLIGSVVCLPLIWLYRSLMVMFPDKNLLEIFDEVYGVVAGKILGVLYLWFFLTLTSVNLTDLSEFSKLTIMKMTPNEVLMLLCVLVAAFVVRKGIKLVTRYCALFVVISFGILAISCIVGFKQLQLQNLLPMFQLPLKQYIQGIHIIATIPFGELVVFLMITPNLKLSSREVSTSMLWAFALGGLVLVLVMLRDAMTLGNMLDLFTTPSLVALRMLNTGLVLSRIEILFNVVLIMLLFFKITFLYYITVITIAQLINLKSYGHIVLCVGLFILLYGLSLYSDPIGHVASAQQVVPIAWTPFEILIPLITWIVAKIRGLSKTETLPQPRGA